MRDDEATPGQQQQQEEEEKTKSDDSGSSSSDDDSSSSSSSSSDSSSDSESEGEEEEGKQQSQPQSQDDAVYHPQSEHDEDGDDEERSRSSSFSYGRTIADRKNSVESVSSSNGLSSRQDKGAAPSEPLNVNSNRAAQRFKAVETSGMGLMALGTKKRDRRTIEEIQRDIQKKRGRSGSNVGISGSNSNGPSAKKASSSSSSSSAAMARSPPRSSPVLSPESGTDTPPLTLGLPQFKLPKGKPTSARSRLAMKVFGRGGRSGASTTAKPKKPAASTTTGVGMVTNISAGKVIKQGPTAGTSSSSALNGTHGGDSEARSSADDMKMEPKIEPRIVDVKPDGKVIRSLLRSMLRYGDLTDVNLFEEDRKAFADEYKLPNFISRSGLAASTKVAEDKLLKYATEIAEQAQKAIEDKHDNMKYADVEIKPSQVIERLYENLKLRVAMQRAMRDAGCPANSSVNGAYVLIAKQCDLPSFGIPKDFPAWSWAEKEHDWNSKKDAALIIGIYLHGFGSWEDILNDDLLHFQQQRALKGERMKKRAENLLKKLPPPDETGEPKIVHTANALTAAAQASTQSLGAQFSAILNHSASGKSAGSASSNSGRMARAAERLAARQAAGLPESTRSVNPEDSIRRSHTQGGIGDRQTSRKLSISSSPPPSTRMDDDDEPEDGEVGASSRRTPASSPKDRSSKSRSKRSASTDQNESPKKKARKHTEKDGDRRRKDSQQKTKKSTPVPRLPALSQEECIEKWKPSKKLKDIRQVLKKMKIMAEWSKEQKDEVIVEKVFKYITTIGETIDQIIVDAGKELGEKNLHEWDELCTCLWTYAAGFTPFSSVVFEQLYDDICADGQALRQEEQKGSTSTRTAST